MSFFEENLYTNKKLEDEFDVDYYVESLELRHLLDNLRTFMRHETYSSNSFTEMVKGIIKFHIVGYRISEKQHKVLKGHLKNILKNNYLKSEGV